MEGLLYALDFLDTTDCHNDPLRETNMDPDTDHMRKEMRTGFIRHWETSTSTITRNHSELAQALCSSKDSTEDEQNIMNMASSTQQVILQQKLGLNNHKFQGKIKVNYFEQPTSKQNKTKQNKTKKNK